MDLGSTLCKAAVCDRRGGIIAEGHSLSPAGGAGPGPEEAQLSAWWRAACTAVQAAFAGRAEDRRRIRAIGVSCRYQAGIFLDTDGRAVAAPGRIPATRALPEVREVHEANGWGPHGPLACGYGPFLVGAALWLRRRHPRIHRRVRRVGALHDYIVFRLSGAWVTDYATGPGGDRWPVAPCALAGFESSAFPAPLPMDTRAGGLATGAARDLDLPAGIPVAVGAQDGACANFGAGATERGDGCVTLSTNAVVRIVTGTLVPGVFGYVVAPSGRWAWVRGIPGGGRFLDAVVAALDGCPTPATADRHAALSPHEPSSPPVRVLDLPVRDVKEIPMRVRALRRSGHAPGAIYAGAVDDIVSAVRGLVAEANATGVTARRYVLTGGLTAAPLLPKRLAEALDAPVTAEVREAAARGAARLAAMTVGQRAERIWEEHTPEGASG
ncbi:MAG TPA: FGGY family carbohydrate kinase [bacterium]|nr:FGGY family carbohydrate kinase [bacterium]